MDPVFFTPDYLFGIVTGLGLGVLLAEALFR
jgi:hypothetical protein